MAKKKDSEKHEDGQKGKYNKDDDANELENFVDDISDEGNADILIIISCIFIGTPFVVSRVTWGCASKET